MYQCVLEPPPPLENKVFWSWMSQAIAEAALITFVPLFLLKGGPGDYGSEVSFFFFGGTTFTLVVLLANSKVPFFFFLVFFFMV